MKKIMFYGVLVFLLGVSPLFSKQQEEKMVAVAEESGKSGEDSITVTDVLGREVTIKGSIKKIAYTHYGSSYMLKILDAWGMVVGRDGYTSDEILFPGLNKIPELIAARGNPYEPNLELLLDLNPDLLILEVIPLPGIEALIEELNGIIPVVAVKTYTPEKVVRSFNIIGKLLGKENEALEYIEWYSDIEKSISDKTENLKEEDKTRMFYKTGFGNVEDLMTFSNDLSYIPARNRITGCINIAQDLPSQGGWVPTLDSEWLISQDFDVLVIGDPLQGAFGILSTDFSILKEHRQKVMELSVFAGTGAVKNNRVYVMGEGFFGTPQFFIGFAYMAKWFHPDLFEDFYPKKIYQEFLNRFMRIDHDLDKSGVFVYPEV